MPPSVHARSAPQVPIPNQELADPIITVDVQLEAEPYPPANASTFQEQIAVLRQKMSDSDRVTLSASVSTWTEISETYGETVDGKLEYIDGHIILTWPTRIHELMSKFTMAPYKQIETQRPDLQCWYNENIGIPGTTSEPIPDVTLARTSAQIAVEDLHLMIFEWAATQSESSLDDKAKMWFKKPSVRVVVTANVETSQYHPPSAKPAAPTLTYEEFCENTNASALGPVVFENLTFHHEIKSVMMYIYRRDGENYRRKSYNITPGELTEALLARFDKATEALTVATRRAIGSDVFDPCFSEDNNFDLRWETFPARFTSAIKQAAYKRYVKWSNGTFLGHDLDVKRKADDEDNDESDYDANERAVVARVAKRLRS
ncbi:hypothetical protein B0H15DRAFT_958348 [Mycena belliarum]|uniref:Uncharacterized protein n=1 Tax=Mycena belliarum TaxID=1033014 RepID=A0AAD6TN48_9AGAR|nr:hypothetical protein B0H15DRAFT_958348 [Mycena belliae]